MGLLALNLAISAVLLWVVFPQGYFAARLLWLGIHKWTGLALSVAVVVHVPLHWNWLVYRTRRLLGGLVAPGRGNVQAPCRDGEWTSEAG
jgi:hypothetical protein